jgi:thymidylate synthase (FAD)
MRGIEVGVIAECSENPGGMMMFLAKLTQRGHEIKCMADLEKLYNTSMNPSRDAIKRVAALPHGTIKRFTPITIAVVGASRRFLAQARTHQVGMTFVSASLQYSDYTGEADFVVPYEIMCDEGAVASYLQSCQDSMAQYKALTEYGYSGDTAGYCAPQGLRNILIIQANHEAWMYFIRLRGCSRNTVETQYVTMLIWEALLTTMDGQEMFACAGPDCIWGKCREGKMSCGNPLQVYSLYGASAPRRFIEYKWPLLKGAQS